MAGSSGWLRGVFAPGMNALIAKNYIRTKRGISKMGMLMFVGSVATMGGSLLLYLGKYVLPFVTEAERFMDIYRVPMIFTILSLIFVALTYERTGVKMKNTIMSKTNGRYTRKVFVTKVVACPRLDFGVVLLPVWPDLRFCIFSSYVGLIFTISYVTKAMGSFVTSRIPLKVILSSTVRYPDR